MKLFSVLLVFLILVNCTSFHSTNNNLREYFKIADNLLMNGEKKELSDFTYQNLFPNVKHLDKNKKARVLNYLQISQDSVYLSIAKRYIKNNTSKISKCTLDSSSISYYNELTSCKSSDYDSLRNNFREIMYRDQYYRQLPDKYFTGTKAAIDSIMSVIIDNDNQNRESIKKALSKYSFKKIAENDCDCSLLKTVWFVAQHSDSDVPFQKEILEMFSRPYPNIKPQYYTYLTDRINMNEGKKQIYGTQMRLNPKTKKMEISPVKNPKKIDQLRFRNNLIDLQVYLNFTNKPDQK